jgi:hypothetical protein
MKDNKPDMIFLIFKIIMTSVMMLLLSLVEPVFGYIWFGAVLIAVPKCLTFAFIGRSERDDNN